VGTGIPPYEINEIIAVVKAYSTCVGAGPFVTEIFGEEASELRERGGDAGEYGATTGRPRRMGWFDAVATRYGCRVQGATCVALTLLDVLGYLDEIPVCVAYDIEGDITQDFPVTPLLPKAKPVYKMFPGWRCDISKVRKYSDLPDSAKRYVEFIEEFIGIPVKMISNGPKREDIILR
jgi:adenylosuccinate synthase